MMDTSEDFALSEPASVDHHDHVCLHSHGCASVFENVNKMQTEVKSKEPPMHSVLLDTEMFRQWRQIAKDQGLDEDADVASLLIQHFQKVPLRCSTCDYPLSWRCTRCADAGTTSVQNTTTTNTPVKEEAVHDGDEMTALQAAGTDGDSDEAVADSNNIKTAEDSVHQVTRRRSARRKTPRKCENELVKDGVHCALEEVASRQQTLTRTNISTESEEYQLYSRLVAKFEEARSDVADPDFVPDGRRRGRQLKVKLFQTKTRKGRGAPRKTASGKSSMGAKKRVRKALSTANADDKKSVKTRHGRRRGSGERRFECERCKATFRGSNDLRRHMRTHTGERPFVCEKCGAAFALASTLKRHSVAHTGHRPYHCEECGSAFYSNAALWKHKRLHSGERPYLCEACGAAYVQPCNLQAHIKKNHTGDMPFACSVCCARFKTASHLAIHEKLHTGEERPYQCTECGVCFPSYVEMKEHKKIHSGKREFKCQKCGDVFRTPKLLTLHMETHRADTESVCSVSHHVPSQECLSLNGLSKNDLPVTAMPTQDDNEVGTFSCSLCNKKLATFEDWKQHTQSHKQDKSFLCKTCGLAFKTTTKLKEHVRTHTGEKPFICTECSAAFSNLTNLKAHIRTHTGFKPFVCKTCNAAFAIAGNLKTHIRTHTGERPYKCSQCSLAFTQAASLQRHMRTHSGDRPYVCDQCGACFASRGNLKRHTKTHTHTGQRSVCEKCGVNFILPANMRTGIDRTTQSLCCGCSSGLVSVPSIITISAQPSSSLAAEGTKNVLQPADTVANAMESAVIAEGNDVTTDVGLDSSHMHAIKITLETLYNSQ